MRTSYLNPQGSMGFHVDHLIELQFDRWVGANQQVQAKVCSTHCYVFNYEDLVMSLIIKIWGGRIPSMRRFNNELQGRNIVSILRY